MRDGESLILSTTDYPVTSSNFRDSQGRIDHRCQNQTSNLFHPSIHHSYILHCPPSSHRPRRRFLFSYLCDSKFNQPRNLVNLLAPPLVKAYHCSYGKLRRAADLQQKIPYHKTHPYAFHPSLPNSTDSPPRSPRSRRTRLRPIPRLPCRPTRNKPLRMALHGARTSRDAIRPGDLPRAHQPPSHIPDAAAFLPLPEPQRTVRGKSGDMSQHFRPPRRHMAAGVGGEDSGGCIAGVYGE